MNLIKKSFTWAKARKSFWLLLIRLVIGGIFIQTGWGKLTHLGTTTAFFQSLGIPFAHYNALAASLIEFVGGLLILTGLLTRLVSIPLICVMIIAIATAQWADVHSIYDFIGLQEVDYILFFGILFSEGAGKTSLDHFIRQAFPTSYLD